MTSKIASVANLAYQVFSKHVAARNAPASLEDAVNHLASSDILPKDTLCQLIELLSSVTPADVDFDSRLLIDSSGFHHAPVVYVHIVENEVFSMGIFVLRQGARIPLHDHPGMYGLCKVLQGSLRVRAYHAIQRPTAPDVACRLQKWQRASLSDLISVRLAGDNMNTKDTRPTLLTPNSGNFHEIQALEGGAAFLDILAPPYDHDLGTRVCRYYREVTLPPVVQQTNQNHGACNGEPEVSESHLDNHLLCSEEIADTLLYLLETPHPSDFVCNSAEYTGPKVT